MVLSITLAYVCVVRTLRCPSSFCTVVMFTPLYINNVALVCRAEWKENALSTPASRPMTRRRLLTFELWGRRKNVSSRPS